MERDYLNDKDFCELLGSLLDFATDAGGHRTCTSGEYRMEVYTNREQNTCRANIFIGDSIFLLASADIDFGTKEMVGQRGGNPKAQEALHELLLQKGYTDKVYPNTYKSVRELSHEQLQELKQQMLDEWLVENTRRGISYGELASVDEYVSDEEVYERFEDITFTDEDFFCTAAEEEEND